MRITHHKYFSISLFSRLHEDEKAESGEETDGQQEENGLSYFFCSFSFSWARIMRRRLTLTLGPCVGKQLYAILREKRYTQHNTHTHLSRDVLLMRRSCCCFEFVVLTGGSCCSRGPALGTVIPRIQAQGTVDIGDRKFMTHLIRLT